MIAVAPSLDSLLFVASRKRSVYSTRLRAHRPRQPDPAGLDVEVRSMINSVLSKKKLAPCGRGPGSSRFNNSGSPRARALIILIKCPCVRASLLRCWNETLARENLHSVKHPSPDRDIQLWRLSTRRRVLGSSFRDPLTPSQCPGLRFSVHFFLGIGHVQRGAPGVSPTKNCSVPRR